MMCVEGVKVVGGFMYSALCDMDSSLAVAVILQQIYLCLFVYRLSTSPLSHGIEYWYGCQYFMWTEENLWLFDKEPSHRIFEKGPVLEKNLGSVNPDIADILLMYKMTKKMGREGHI